MKKVFGFIKKNLITCVCLFLAAAVLLTGTISYSKYISTDPANEVSAAGSFYCSGSVDSVSSLSFANMNFWSGTGDDKIAMNSVHSINFVVNNYQETTDVNGTVVSKTVSAVKMRYMLVFTAPFNFADKLAIQLFENYSTVLLPQIVLEDLMNTANGGIYDTATSEDYQEEPFGDNGMKFTVTQSSSLLNGASLNSYTATAALSGGGNVVINLEPVLSELDQVLKFRLWDVSDLDYDKDNPAVSDGGDLKSSVLADLKSQVPCYRISISMPQFVFSAGTEEQSKYSIRFAPTSMLDDYQLGGELYEENGDILESLYAGKSVTVHSLKETVTDKDAGGNIIAEDSYYIFGNPIKYAAGETEILSESTTTETTTSDPVTGNATNVSLGAGYLYIDSDFNIVDSGSADYAIYVNSSNNGGSQTQTTTKITTTAEKTTETMTTNSVSTDGANETITQTITETIEKNITETTITRTVTNYSGYSVYSATNGYYVYYKDSEGTWQQDSSLYQTLALPRAITKTETSESDSTSTEGPTVTNQYTRTIVRGLTSSDTISFDRVYYEEEDENGTLQIYEYDSKDRALELFDADDKQLYFISQCYSKSFPFTVNVIFEQIQS